MKMEYGDGKSVEISEDALGLAEPEVEEPEVHVLRDGVVCDTERRGHETPRPVSPVELVVDASEGFIPLWARGTTLRWRFQERSMSAFRNPAAAKTAIRQLLGSALLAWGDATPVRFTERRDAWDFEIVMRRSDRCTVNGCVLASAFFPDGGRHELVLYPKMFTQGPQELKETMIHEIGHIFGLRHFFALVSESAFPAEVFGTHRRFSIMNYGEMSMLTDADKADLRRLYQLAWSGRLTEINGTPIRFVRPFHSTSVPDEAIDVGAGLPGAMPPTDVARPARPAPKVARTSE